MRDKLAGYFLLPSIMRYLIEGPDEKLVIHHARHKGDARTTCIVCEGDLQLDPPGIIMNSGDIAS